MAKGSKKEKPLTTSTNLVLKPSTSFTKHNRQYLSKLTDFLPDIIYIYHLQLQKTLFVNKAFTDTLGYTQKALLTGEISWNEIIHPADINNAPSISESISRLADQATIEYEIQCKTINDIYIWLHNKLTIFTRGIEGEPEQVLVTSHDITYRKNLEKKLIHQAYTDQLTGLVNRTSFMEKLNSKIEKEPHAFAVLFLDINEFKSINDTYGHLVGDKVIVEVAKRLSNVMPEPNVVARLGGDEFTLVVDSCGDEKTLKKHISLLENSLAVELCIKNIKLNLNVSIGSVLAKKVQNPTPSKLLKIADQAMYKAKKQFYEQRLDHSKTQKSSKTDLKNNS